jgi:HlyD family secretion protein
MRPRHRAALPALLAALALGAGCGEEAPPHEIRVSGYVEATAVRLAPQVGGPVAEVAVREGDSVRAGDEVLRIDTRELERALDRARAEQRAAEVQLALLQAGARPQEIAQAEAQAQAARDELAAARAELEAAQADLDRFEALLEARAGSRKQRDDAATRRDVARQRVQAASSRVRAAEEVVARLRAGARPEEIEAAQARVAAARAQVRTAEDALGDATLRSPIAGIVTERLVEPGEIVAPRSPVLVVTNLADAWADVFVPEPMIPRLRLGQEATIYTDAGGPGLAGRVRYISPEAEFTPRNVQTAEERSKLVYRVRVAVDNTSGVLKQGMPVEAVLPLQ